MDEKLPLCGRKSSSPPARDLLFGFAIALTIAAYTLVDAEGVDHAQAPAYLFLLLAPSSVVYAAALALRGRASRCAPSCARAPS